MKARVLVLMVMLAMLVALIPAASAQETMCFNLSEADCTVFTETTAVTAPFTSANINFTFDLSVTGIAALDPSASDITIAVTGTGPVVVNQELMTAENPFAGMESALDLTLSVTGTEDDQSISTKVVLKDGIAYIQNPEDGKWYGMSIEEAMGTSGVPVSPEMLNPTTMGNMAGMGDLAALAEIPGFITMERLADESINGANAVGFSTTIDFLPLLTSPAFAEALGSQMGAGADASQMAQMIPMLLGQSTATMNVSQWTGADDKMIHRFSLDVDANIDLANLMMMMGGGAGASAAPSDPIVVDLSMTADFTDHGGSFEIVAPEGAIMEGSS